MNIKMKLKSKSINLIFGAGKFDEVEIDHVEYFEGNLMVRNTKELMMLHQHVRLQR